MKNDPIRSCRVKFHPLIGAALGLALMGATAQAATPLEPKAADRAVTAMADKEPQAARTADALPPNCQRARRKFFVADEGWIVRKVTTCY